MQVIISSIVQSNLDTYKNILLSSYRISEERAITKYDMMASALYSIGQNPNIYPICMYKDLGQVFNRRNKPIYTTLHRFNYKDESGFQWAFAYVVTDSSVTITKMMPSNQVKESTEQLIHNPIQQILELEQRWNNLQ